MGWQSKLLKILITGVKLAFTELLKGLYNRFTACVNGLINKAVSEFIREPSQKLAEDIEKLQAKYDEFKVKLEAEFESRFGSFDELIKNLVMMEKWVKLASDLKTFIQLTAQIYACFTPPGLGCLWGLVVNISIEAAMDLLVKSKQFRERIVKPAIQDAINRFAGPVYQSLVTESIELVELQVLCPPGWQAAASPT